MTTPTTGTPAPTDSVLPRRAATSADLLHALITTSMLDTAGHPDQLPGLLFPDLPAEQVQRIWDAAMTVGFRAGKMYAQRTWAPTTLDTARQALEDAGHERMAAAVTVPEPWTETVQPVPPIYLRRTVQEPTARQAAA